MFLSQEADFEQVKVATFGLYCIGFPSSFDSIFQFLKGKRVEKNPNKGEELTR